jgi:inorganic pyrophosphatase
MKKVNSIPARDAQGLAHVIIDTPQGSRNKYKYDEESGCFKLSRVLPIGMCFPHDFGSIPGTLSADGDPLDVLVLVEAPSFAGCLMQVHLIGLIEAEQSEHQQTIRNDRLIAVAETPVNKPAIRNLDKVSAATLNELEQFFINYNHVHGREFRPISRGDSLAAQRVVDAGIQKYQQQRQQP